jgi:hypothetical protein
MARRHVGRDKGKADYRFADSPVVNCEPALIRHPKLRFYKKAAKIF